MKLKKYTSIFIMIALTLEGCAYSVRFDPALESYAVSRESPRRLEITLQRGNVRYVARGQETELNKNLTEYYVVPAEQALRNVGMFTYESEGLRNADADLFVDFEIHEDFNYAAIFLYGFFLGVLSMFTPLPVPINTDMTFLLTLRKKIAGQVYVVRTYECKFGWDSLYCSAWGTITQISAQKARLAEYLTVVFKEKFSADYDYYASVAQVLQERDPAKLISVFEKGNA